MLKKLYSVYVECVFFTDYSAPLSEAGDITLKYTALRNVLKELASDSIRMFNTTQILIYCFYSLQLADPLPAVPPNTKKVAYGMFNKF